MGGASVGERGGVVERVSVDERGGAVGGVSGSLT